MALLGELLKRGFKEVLHAAGAPTSLREAFALKSDIVGSIGQLPPLIRAVVAQLPDAPLKIQSIAQPDPVKTPSLDDRTFKAEKVQGDDIIKSVDKIHADIVSYQNIVNKNTIAVFGYVHQSVEQQENRIGEIGKNTQIVKKSYDDMILRFGRIERRIKALEDKQGGGDDLSQAFSQRGQQKVSGDDVVLNMLKDMFKSMGKEALKKALPFLLRFGGPVAFMGIGAGLTAATGYGLYGIRNWTREDRSRMRALLGFEETEEDKAVPVAREKYDAPLYQRIWRRFKNITGGYGSENDINEAVEILRRKGITGDPTHEQIRDAINEARENRSKGIKPPAPPPATPPNATRQPPSPLPCR
jgi:hypothetical protein